MKKIISLCLVVSILLNIPVFSYAANSDALSKDFNFTYVDESGTTIQISLIKQKDGTITGKQYNNKVLVGETIIDPRKQAVESIRYNKQNKVESKRQLKVSKAISKIEPKNALFSSNYSYNGTLHYNSYYDTYYDTTYNASLKTYVKTLKTDEETYTINGEQYDLVLDIISLLVSYLCGMGASAVVAENTAANIISAFASYKIMKVVDGELKKAFTEDVATTATHYKLEAICNLSGATKYFDGTKYIVKTKQSKAYNQTIYDGYYPQFINEQDNTVAYWLFNQFLSYSYPGVDW